MSSIPIELLRAEYLGEKTLFVELRYKSVIDPIRRLDDFRLRAVLF
jgi:hypothetical protein